MISKILADELKIKLWQSEASIKLIDEGNTIPFIARYRKEATGSLNDDILRKFEKRLIYLRNFQERKSQVLKSIEEQDKLTEQLRIFIKKTKTLAELEDIYRPYKPKKRTKSTIAKEKGLKDLADLILEQKTKIPFSEIAKDYLNKGKGVFSIEEAIEGAQHIITEIISDNPIFRKYIRKITLKLGYLTVNAKNKDEISEYEMYYDYNEKLSKIAFHRILAINRGEKEKYLKVKIDAPIEEITEYLNSNIILDYENSSDNSTSNEIIKESILDSYKRLIAPSIERKIRNSLTGKAEDRSIIVFSKNLEQLLMQIPIQNKIVLGWDPGFRTGCKLAVVDKFGKVLDTNLIYPNEPQNKVEESKKIVLDLIQKYNVDIISLGNGTASRESEQLIVDIIKKHDIHHVIVNEAGASVYSASETAADEFPDFNLGERSAISIARRLQDPLAELVKVDPKAIGVGQYQHDMNQKKLDESLKSIVEKTVNIVGVDLNTASITLLRYVSGINNIVAKNIVKYREENGVFKSRKELLKVPKIGAKSFQQCAGFLKVYESDNLLDITTVHPESYQTTEKLIKNLGYDLGDFKANNNDLKKINFDKLKNLEDNDFKNLSEELAIGEITLKDIVNELKKPRRDPREDSLKPILRNDTLEIEDLEKEMVLEGTVRNIVDFGVFVDVGVHQDGLVHISQMVENKFVKHPLDIVCVGDIVKVKVVDIDVERRRIQLSMII
jgi:uncharacterized protein